MLERMWRNGNAVHCWWKCKLVHQLWKTVMKFPQNPKNKTII